MTKQLEALIAEMKSAAEKATPGQWIYLPENTSVEYDVGSDDPQGSIVYMDSGDFTQKATDLNGTHVAAANPANVLTLIAALEQAQQYNKELQTKLDATEAVALALRDDTRGAHQRIAAPEATLELEREKSRRVMSRNHQLDASPLAMPDGIHPDTANLVTTFAEALAAKLRKAEIKYGYDSDWKKDGWQGQCLAHFHQHIGKGDPLDVAAYCAFMWHHNWPTAASPAAVKLPDELIDEVCLAAAEIHNRGNGVDDDKAQFIIDCIRNYLENGGQVEGE